MAIRRLNERERVEWVELAKEINRKFEKANKAVLLEEMERAKCEVERAEVVVLVLERLLRKKGDNDYHNPIPTRKAVEAVSLAFPKFHPKVAAILGGR